MTRVCLNDCFQSNLNNFLQILRNLSENDENGPRKQTKFGVILDSEGI